MSFMDLKLAFHGHMRSSDHLCFAYSLASHASEGLPAKALSLLYLISTAPRVRAITCTKALQNSHEPHQLKPQSHLERLCKIS